LILRQNAEKPIKRNGRADLPLYDVYEQLGIQADRFFGHCRLSGNLPPSGQDYER